MLQGRRLIQNEQLSFWEEVKIPNGIGIIKLGSKLSLNMREFISRPNLLEKNW
jgi:hypothetical protein